MEKKVPSNNIFALIFGLCIFWNIDIMSLAALRWTKKFNKIEIWILYIYFIRYNLRKILAEISKKKSIRWYPRKNNK